MGFRMIFYQLRCVDEHSFEAWFRDSTGYDEQVRSGVVECPYCGSTDISKAPMAPHIGGTAPDGADAGGERETDEHRANAVARKILDAVGRMRDYAEQNFEDVGDEFADQARKIHSGEEPGRGIYGTASDQDAEDLEEEGIEFVRLPGPPRRDS